MPQTFHLTLTIDGDGKQSVTYTQVCNSADQCRDALRAFADAIDGKDEDRPMPEQVVKQTLRIAGERR